MKYHRAESDRWVARRLLLELEIDGSTFHILATVVAKLQLHFVAQQAPVELERAVGRGFFLKQRR